MTTEHQAAIYAREAEQAAIRGSHTKAEALLAKCLPWSQTSGPVAGLCTLARAEIAFRQSRFAQASVLGELAANILAKCGRTQDALRSQEIQPRVWSRDGDEQRVVARSQSLLERWETLAGQEAIEGQVRCLTLITLIHARRFRYEAGIASGTRAVSLARSLPNKAAHLPRAGNALAGLHFAKACALHPSTGWASHLTPSRRPMNPVSSSIVAPRWRCLKKCGPIADRTGIPILMH